jgi:uncharacterized protein YndB with AHSA1/START domain
VTRLASGRCDALSGRFLTIGDDLELLLQGTTAICRDQLYSLRVNRFSTAGSAPPARRSIAAAATGPAGLTLRLEPSLPLPIEETFAAWIDPAAIARWFIHAADVRWLTGAEIDARPGGKFRFHVAGAAGFDFTGAYREITEFKRLEFTWRWRSLPIFDGPGDTSVVVEFEQSEETRVTLVQTHLAHQEALDAHRRGWERCLDGMVS